MDVRPERMKDAFRRIEVFWDGENRFYRGTVLCYHAASGLHTVAYDDGQKAKEDLLVRPQIVVQETNKMRSPSQIY